MKKHLYLSCTYIYSFFFLYHPWIIYSFLLFNTKSESFTIFTVYELSTLIPFCRSHHSHIQFLQFLFTLVLLSPFPVLCCTFLGKQTNLTLQNPFVSTNIHKYVIKQKSGICRSVKSGRKKLFDALVVCCVLRRVVLVDISDILFRIFSFAVCVWVCGWAGGCVGVCVCGFLSNIFFFSRSIHNDENINRSIKSGSSCDVIFLLTRQAEKEKEKRKESEKKGREREREGLTLMRKPITQLA